MAKIKKIEAREILNAKGHPTVEVALVLADGTLATASSPGRTSLGGFEAAEVIDNDQDRYKGLGVLKAIENIKSIIAPRIIGIEVNKQQEIDKIMIELDGTQNKSRLGANAMLALSMVVSRAAAKSSALPLFVYLREFIKKEGNPLKIPTPIFNLLNGGKIAGGNLDFQSFLVIPVSSKPYSESLEMGANIYSTLRNDLGFKNLPTLVGDEGGFAPNLATNEDGLNIIKQSIENTAFRVGFDVFLGIDASSNSFYSEGKYKIKDSAMQFSSSDLTTYYENLNKKFHLLYLEDPLYEEDWNGWVDLTNRISANTIVAGDHLTSTNPYRLQIALDKKAISGIVVKPSQVGTVIETLAVVEVARQAGLKIIVSATSAETTDDFIADFAAAVSSDYVKFGATARGENVAKYNRLLEIEDQIKAL
ncbi:MAG: phosphopyruvate hydratase [Candidatus Levybacteria bacterium RIFCSPLOWO2_01_FULL_38_21]|nr:MAG: phosphopyruvate hydratase [Candidatus Levybacteria bacterium RIFCSPLOWO2_01_FULL_38_21]